MARSVLVVDDEPNIVRSLEFLMNQAGYRVRIVRDGEQALAAIEAEPPDLVLLDVMMPKRDGFQVCREVRANPDWRDIRIIMLTAKGQEAERERGIEMGADDYVTKPFSTRALVRKVREMLDPEDGPEERLEVERPPDRVGVPTPERD